jgi:hemoglobin-like flavoprotein
MASERHYVALFAQSYIRALQFTDENKKFLDRFYEIFFSKSPAIAQLFKDTDMGTQKTMLQDSILYMKDFCISKTANEHMRRIAKVHSKSGKNIPGELYDVWLDSLIEAAREYDSEFTEETERAWRIALAPGINYMKQMYDRS